MKRFLVFAYWGYYPSGGWNDFKESFDSLEEAKAYAKSLNMDYYDIVDIETGEQIE